MRNLRLRVEYDGTDFAGWQRQPPPFRTVQQVLEDAVRVMVGEVTLVRGAGRTDAGVHAEGQVASFQTTTNIGCLGFLRGLNASLPFDVAVTRCTEAPDDFDPRFSARGKRYVYRVLDQEIRSPLSRRRTWHVRPPLCMDAMQRAARPFIGKRDFSALQASDCGRDNTVRDIRRLDVDRDTDGLVVITVEADAFLKHMVRTIAGTLVESGLGKRDPDTISAMLASGDRRLAGRTAPAAGLTLAEVFYDV